MAKRYKYKGKIYTKEELVKKINDILLSSLVSTKRDTIRWIKKNVPKRTGQLRKNLIIWMERKWRMEKNKLTISLGTNTDYGLDITGDSAHTSTWFEHSGIPAVANYGGHSGPIFLHDPHAISEWDTLIGAFITDKFKIYMKSYKEIYLG